MQQHLTKLNLIWQTLKGEQTEFEYEYITQVLFKDFDATFFFDERSYKTVIDNSVIIYSNASSEAPPELIHYFNKFRKKKFRFYLLHLSNEGLNHDYWYYTKANFVFRNYFDPAIKAYNVLFIPLGFKSGYFNKENLMDGCPGRPMAVSFVGQPKADRFELIDAMEKFDNHFIHKTTSWNCPTALTQDQVIKLYQKTEYAPCPGGNVHPDSFRICESLEWGCIPIVRTVDGTDFFKHTYGDHPFEVVNDWSELECVIKKVDYCAKKKQVDQWYSTFKTDLQARIKDIIESGGIEPKPRFYLKKELNCERKRFYNRGRNIVKKIYYAFK